MDDREESLDLDIPRQKANRFQIALLVAAFVTVVVSVVAVLLAYVV